jgi:hypothetical protein
MSVSIDGVEICVRLELTRHECEFLPVLCWTLEVMWLCMR